MGGKIVEVLHEDGEEGARYVLIGLDDCEKLCVRLCVLFRTSGEAGI